MTQGLPGSQRILDWMRVVLALMVACGTGARSEPASSTTEVEPAPVTPTQPPTPAPTSTIAPGDGFVAPAFNAILFEEVLVVQPRRPEDAHARFEGRAPATGEVRWTTDVPHPAHGTYAQRFGEHHVLLLPAGELLLLDVRNGALTARHRYSGGKRFDSRNAGVCLLTDECSALVVDCADARPLTTLRQARGIRRRMIRGDDGQLHHGPPPSCRGAIFPVGRWRDTLIVHIGRYAGEVPNAPPAPRFHPGTDALLGLDAATGDVRWAQPAPCTVCNGAHAGLVGDDADAAVFVASDDAVLIFDPHGGTLRYRIESPGVDRVLVHEPSRTVLVQDAQHVRTIRLAPRAPVEQSRAPREGRTFVLEGARYPVLGDILLRAYADTEVVTLDTDGTEVARATIPPSSTLVPGERGRWQVLRAYTNRDNAGQGVPMPGHVPRYVVERSHRPRDERGPPNHARVLFDGDPIVEVDQDAWSLGEFDVGRQRGLVLFVHDTERWQTRDEVRVLVRAP